jgi:repressor LexA
MAGSANPGSANYFGMLIRNLRVAKGLTKTQLATAVGLSPGFISRIESGERRPALEKLRRLAEELGATYQQLAIAAGMLSDAPSNSVNRRAIRVSRRAVPVFDSVPAGLFKDSNVVEASDDLLYLVLAEDELNHDPRAFALIVTGDSMVEAGILDGDVIVVSPNTRVANGDIAVVSVNKQATSVKRVYFEDNSILLQPCNSNFRPMVLSGNEVEVLGKVILVRRKLG